MGGLQELEKDLDWGGRETLGVVIGYQLGSNGVKH